MTCKAAFVFTPDLLKYSFSEAHPFNPLRLQLTIELMEAYGLLEQSEYVQPRPASLEQLLTFHDLRYLQMLNKLSGLGASDEGAHLYGLGTEDNPIFPGMFEAGSLVVGATITAAELVMEGKFNHAMNLAGGLHHAHSAMASGFCILNDAVVAIKQVRKNYNCKVVYIDNDAHHGDGVQWAFYEDPNVLTISIHETGRYLFPGTGKIAEIGKGLGYGYSVNVPLEAFTEDESWIKNFREVVVPVVKAFNPDILISQNGCDGHYYDPLTHLSASTLTYREIPRIVHRLAHEVCDGRWVAIGGGGYDIWKVVPRAWTLLWAEMKGVKVPLNIPEAWIKKWSSFSPSAMPINLNDNQSELPIIPRRPEIEEKNYLSSQRVLNSVVPIINGIIG